MPFPDMLHSPLPFGIQAFLAGISQVDTGLPNSPVAFGYSPNFLISHCFTAHR